MILFIVISMWLLEFASEDSTVQSTSGEWTTVISSYGSFFIVALIVTFIYFIFLFEAKKDNSLLIHPIWRKMPKISVIIGILSVILFIVGGTVGPVMSWVEQWRSLFYVFLVYFLFLVFLFIFSFENKKQRASQQSQKSIHISYIWTLLLFFVLYFLF
jgi:heme/copper-type cytochrome/quinol oxidase subunit 2